jgi:hypothetical protein
MNCQSPLAPAWETATGSNPFDHRGDTSSSQPFCRKMSRAMGGTGPSGQPALDDRATVSRLELLQEAET